MALFFIALGNQEVLGKNQLTTHEIDLIPIFFCHRVRNCNNAVTNRRRESFEGDSVTGHWNNNIFINNHGVFVVIYFLISMVILNLMRLCVRAG